MTLRTVSPVALKLLLYGACRWRQCSEMGSALDTESECLGLILVPSGSSFMISESYLTYFIV